jgi:hypothetical protein
VAHLLRFLDKYPVRVETTQCYFLASPLPPQSAYLMCRFRGYRLISLGSLLLYAFPGL